jgi:hypothetical protein
MTLVTSIVWAVVGVYSAVRDPVQIEVEPSLLEPLTPTIDQDTINKLSVRRGIGENELQALVTLVNRQETLEEEEAQTGAQRTQILEIEAPVEDEAEAEETGIAEP